MRLKLRKKKLIRKEQKKIIVKNTKNKREKFLGDFKNFRRTTK